MRFIFLLTAMSAVISCERTTKGKNHFDSISKIDTTCLEEIKVAKTDIEKSKLIYCHFAGSMLYHPLRNAHEMDSLLKSFGIEYKEEITSDVIFEDQTQGCYCDFMKEKIDDKFGKSFIDSLLDVSDSLYVLNNINDTFYYANCDTQPGYPGDIDTNADEYSENFQTDLETAIRYPKDYIKRPNYDSAAFVDVHLIVDKNGSASITGFWFIFDMTSNNKYESYFENKIEKIMKKTGWTSATIRKQKVNSDMVTRLFFD